MDAAELAALKRMYAEEADLLRRERLLRTGAASSDVNDLRNQEASQLLPRANTPTREAIQWLTIHLRDFMKSSREYTWRMDPLSGNTDVASSSILVDSSLGANIPDDISMPRLFVSGAPAGSEEVGIGNLRSWNIRTNDRTYTGLDIVTLSIGCRATSRAQALDLGALMTSWLRAHRDEICRQRWVDISAPIVRDLGGQGAQGSSYVFNVDVLFNATVQWTTEVRLQEGVGHVAEAAAVEVDLLLGSEEDPGPHFIDGRPQGGLQVLNESELLSIEDEL